MMDALFTDGETTYLEQEDTASPDVGDKTLAAFLREADHPSAALYVEEDDSETSFELVRGLQRIEYRGTTGDAYFSGTVTTDDTAVRYLEDETALEVT